MDLTRTAAALYAYDAEACLPLPDDFKQAWAKINRKDQLAREVGRAYGLDTAHINNVAVCEALIRPGNLLRLGGLAHGTRKQGGSL